MSDTNALFDAINTDDTAAVERLIAARPALAGARDENGVSAVMFATYRGRLAARAALLARLSELDIFEATATGDGARVASLLAADPNAANATSPDGFPVVALAAFFGQPAVLDLLLEHGADADRAAANPMRVTAAHAAAAHHNRGVALAMMQALVDHGVDVNAVQQGGWTPLHAAAKDGPPAMVELLLSRGADPTACTEDGATPLAVAEGAGQHEIVARLRAAVPT